MRSAIVSTAFAAAALAAPVVERQAAPGGPGDGVILNYALTLEHLENAFYKEGLAKFSQADFAAAGLDNVFYTNLKTISSDEQTHVDFLSGALTTAGVKPVVPNTYSFGFEDIPTFLTIANVLEGVGVSAYLGAAQFIADATYLTAAGSILTVEARHSAYLRQNQTPQQSPFPAPFDIPLDFNEVVTLAAPFITAIAPENGPLPVNGFPAITATPGAGKAGDKIALAVAKEVDAKAAYFITITGSVEATLEGSGKEYSIVIPADAPAGQSYVVLTKEKVTGTPSDDNIVAGPAIIQIADAQSGVIPDPKKCVDGKPVPAPYKPEPEHPAPYKPEHPKQPEQPKKSLTTIYETKTYTSHPKETAPVYPTKSEEKPHPKPTKSEEKPHPYPTKSEEKPHPKPTTYPSEAPKPSVYPSQAPKAPVYKSEEHKPTTTAAPVYSAPPAYYN